MNNVQSDSLIQARVADHFQELLEHFPMRQVVGIFLQGSQNYNLGYEKSDVDTKAILLPSLDDIVCGRKGVSTTHIRNNDEHIDFKDIRLFAQTLRKQNIHFVEILFTPYFVINPTYAKEWQRLVGEKEAIGRYSEFLGLKATKGMAMKKFHALRHPYPTQKEVLERFGYDPKQLHHLLRLERFVYLFTMEGASYQDCLECWGAEKDRLLEVKRGKAYCDSEVDAIGSAALRNITDLVDTYTQNKKGTVDQRVERLLDTVQGNIVRTALKLELEGL